ncbi:MAG: ATP-binding protein [Clostridium sp.]|nr:ATP-binding protein [Clostridium sp.]
MGNGENGQGGMEGGVSEHKWQKLLANVFLSMGCGVICYRERDGKLIAINQAALNILGYESRADLEAEGFDGIAKSVVEEDRYLLFDKIRLLQHKNDRQDVEYRVQHKDGSIVYVYGDIQLFIDEDGESIIQRTLLDVTERKRLEMRLFKEQANRVLYAEAEKAEAVATSREYTAILTGLNKLFLETYYVDFITDEYQMVGANGEYRFTEQLNGSYDKVLEEYVEYSVYEADREKVLRMGSRRYAREHLNLDNPFYSFVYRRLTGKTYRWYRINLILSSITPDGKLKNVVVAFMDVNDEKQKEDTYQRRLEETNQSLTFALVQENKYKEELKGAYDAAMKANQAKNEFLSNMSHDMRTPMNGIMGMTKVAVENVNNPQKVREYLGKIEKTSKYLLEFINNVLDMSKIESRDTTITKEEIVLSDILKTVALIAQPKVRDKGHKFAINVHEVRHEHLIGDSLHLNQIFINIIRNAIIYTPKGGDICMDVTELPDHEDGYANLKFVISDNGIGMSKEFLPHLFEMFTQERTKARTHARGSGLGMAIAYNLVTMMGGSLTAQSEIGEGSVFTVCIPLKISRKYSWSGSTSTYMIHVEEDVDKWVDIMASREDYVDMEAEESFENCRILVVEDNEINMEIMVEVLQQKKAIVERAMNGQIGFDLFVASEPGYYDVILMDIKMPVKNGYEAAQMIRQSDHPDAGTVPIIALSADAFEDDIERALQAGMNAHVAKPVDFKILYWEMKKCMDKRKESGGDNH